ENAPTKFWLSTLGANVTFTHLVHTAKLRWRIERDYLELKQEIGLGHFEGRGWRGFHHHVGKFGFGRTFLTKWWASSPIARGASRRRASLAIGGAKMEDHHDARAEESDSGQGRLTGTRQAARQRVAGLQGDGIQPR